MACAAAGGAVHGVRAQKGEAVETEWSMNDMIFASFKFAESGGALIWTDDALEDETERVTVV